MKNVVKLAVQCLPVLFIIVLCSCDQSEMREFPDDTLSSQKVKTENVKNSSIELVEMFNKSLNGEQNTKSLDSHFEDIIIDECIKTTYHFSLDKRLMINNQVDVDSTSVDLFLVNFHNPDGTPGYSIVSGDDRINKVYLYSRGQIADTAKIYPLACVVKAIPSVLEKDLNNFYQNPIDKKNSRSLITNYGPLISTHWDQDYPYNSQCPRFSENDKDFYLKGRAPAGCATIAAAQVVVYYSKFTSGIINSGKRYVYDFMRLKSNAKVDKNNAEMVFQVGQLCKELGEGIGVKWSADKGDLADPRKISKYLSDVQGYSIETWNDKNVDINKMANNIMRGNPHITAGMRKKPRSGHVWIWDGVKIDIVNSVVTMVHCNWGMGYTNTSLDYADTWFTPETMEQPDPDEQPYFDDNVQIYITGYQFNPGPVE